MVFTQEAQGLVTSAFVELFELDLSKIAPTLPTDQQILRFSAQKNERGLDVVWQGHTYLAYPIQASGFNINGNNSPPRPTIKAANLSGILTDLCLAHNDLIGAKLIRHRTFARFLDAVNFSAGNPNADPDSHYPDDVFFVERRALENNAFIEWELRWPYDLEGVVLPGRVITEDICVSVYKSPECTWIPNGHYFDVTDQPCAAGNDDCSHKITGCKLRFGAKVDLPFGAFPGAGMVRQ
ncbi:MAG: phage minor tail protein L [Methylovulum sp.]|nr:phage minor tail protein L [Methylovulum sp.]